MTLLHPSIEASYPSPRWRAPTGRSGVRELPENCEGAVRDTMKSVYLPASPDLSAIKKNTSSGLCASGTRYG
jgi:hypothetical protein